jgi:acetyl esterase
LERTTFLVTPEIARTDGLALARARKFPVQLPIVHTRDYLIPTHDGTQITVRLYKPEIINTAALMIYYHGGGYVVGNLETHDMACRWMATSLQTPFIAVDYRLAPEYPFPVLIEDGYSAFEWITQNAKELGITYKQLIVGGDSAGANLATIVSILARDRYAAKIDLQFLLYPWVSNNIETTSYNKYAENHLLSKKDCVWLAHHYLANAGAANYSAFPLEDANLQNLPTAFVVVAECDVLHDEGVAYAQKLRAAGNIVYEYEAEGMIHGFLNQFPLAASFNTMNTILAKFQTLLF